MMWFRKKPAREREEIPTTVEQAIPILATAEDGIFQVGRQLWAKTFRFSDVNYAIASGEEQERLFLAYADILNSLDASASTKITLNNRRIHRSRFERTCQLPPMKDGLDDYRQEYNSILERNAGMSSGIIQDKYLTVTVEKKTIAEARSYFARVGAEFSAMFAHLGSTLTEVGEEEKLRILYEFFHHGNEDDFRYDRKTTRLLGHGFKDAIAPESLAFWSDSFMIDGRYGRVLYLRDYANFIEDDILSTLSEIDRNLMISIDMEPIPMDQAVKQGESRLLAVETNITNWQRKQNQRNNYSAMIPYDMEQQRKESREFLDDLVARDQRMIPALITLVHTADSKEQLDADTESIRQAAQKKRCSLSVLRWRQLEGLNTVLPYGGTRIGIRRTLTTESLTVFVPFRVQEVTLQGGLWIGNNALSRNLILVNRGELLNGNAFICGVSGSGKSILAKQQIIGLYLADPEADVIVIDPEREYRRLCDALGGETVVISAESENHINALEINRSYADGNNPVAFKSEFVLSLCEQIMGTLGSIQKSVLDRCVSIVYRDYLTGGCQGKAPTLADLHQTLLSQSEPEAKEVALAIELFVSGSLDTFAKPTNVNTDSRLLCYDIHDLGKQLLPVGMLVVLDSILNRITANREKGRKTYIFLDEIYLLFRHEYSANFLFTMWKRVRKYGAFITGITQNVEDLLGSHTARTMLANSELVILLNQAATDREQLAQVMGISREQMKFITNVGFGEGLVKIGSALVPFVNRIPKDNRLYTLMTTKFGEET